MTAAPRSPIPKKWLGRPATGRPRCVSRRVFPMPKPNRFRPAPPRFQTCARGLCNRANSLSMENRSTHPHHVLTLKRDGSQNGESPENCGADEFYALNFGYRRKGEMEAPCREEIANRYGRRIDGLKWKGYGYDGQRTYKSFGIFCVPDLYDPRRLKRNLGMHFTPLAQQVDSEHGRLSANHGRNAGLVFD